MIFMIFGKLYVNMFVLQRVVWVCMRPAVVHCQEIRLMQWTSLSWRSLSIKSVSSTVLVRDTNTRLSRSPLCHSHTDCTVYCLTINH